MPTFKTNSARWPARRAPCILHNTGSQNHSRDNDRRLALPAHSYLLESAQELHMIFYRGTQAWSKSRGKGGKRGKGKSWKEVGGRGRVRGQGTGEGDEGEGLGEEVLLSYSWSLDRLICVVSSNLACTLTRPPFGRPPPLLSRLWLPSSAFRCLCSHLARS